MIYLYQTWEHVPVIIKVFYRCIYDILTSHHLQCEYLHIDNVHKLTDNDIVISDIRLYIPRIGGIQLHHTHHKIVIINAEELFTLGGSYLHFLNKIYSSGRCLAYLDYSAFNYTAHKVIQNPPRIHPEPSRIIRDVYASHTIIEQTTFGLMYHPSLVYPPVTKNIDVLFCGNITEKRAIVLESLKRRCPQYTFCIQPHIDFNTYVTYIRQSNISIILSRFNDFCDFDMYRISLMIPNNVLVVHETINEVDRNSKAYDTMKQVVDFSDIHSFPDKIHHLLQLSDSERLALCARRKDLYMKHFNLTSRMNELIDVLKSHLKNQNNGNIIISNYELHRLSSP